MDLGGFAITAALERAGVTGDQVDYVIMGHVIQAGAGQITARQAAVKGGIPMSVPAADGQQGVPVRAERDRDGRPADRLRRVRHRRGRRHGVDDQRPVPAARRPRRVPLRRHRPGRLDRARRPVLRVRPARDGRGDRRLQQAAQDRPRRTGRVRGAVARAGRRARKNGAVRRRDRDGRRCPQRKGDPTRSSPTTRASGRAPPPRALGKLRPAFAADGTVTAGSAVADLRRRRRGGRHVPGEGRGARRHRCWPRSARTASSPARPVAAVPAVQRDPQGAAAGRA